MPETICAWCKHLLHCLGFVAAKHGLIFAKSFWVFNLSERLKREAERNLWQVNDESSSPLKKTCVSWPSGPQGKLMSGRSSSFPSWNISTTQPCGQHERYERLWKCPALHANVDIACQKEIEGADPTLNGASKHPCFATSSLQRRPRKRFGPQTSSQKESKLRVAQKITHVQIQSSILLASFKMLQTTKQEHLHYPPSRFTRSGRLISRRLDFTAKHGLVWFPSCKKPAELQWAKGAPKPLAASHIPKAQGQSSQDARCSSAGSQKNIGNKCSRFFSTLLALGTIVTIWPTKKPLQQRIHLAASPTSSFSILPQRKHINLVT